MQGSLYPNGVLIDRTALRRTETSKASQILRMRTDITSRGVFSGGEITVSLANPDRIDIAAFSGYTPRGDYIVETSSSADVALADYSSTTVNVICAVYTESNIHNQPHETDGNVYPTEAEGSYRIRVFSQSDFDDPLVLPPTDSNLQNDAVDRCLILGKVTAEGVGNPLTTIQDPTNYNNILYTSPQQLLTITGVTILSIDPLTPTGTGTLTFDDTGAPPYSFKYTSPGGIISGAVTTSSDAVLTITDGSLYWIEIQVVLSQLPLGLVVPYAETFEVINLYYQEIPRLTAEDNLHRNFLGTGIVTPINAHGYSLDDFAGQTLSLLDEHQDVMHCNGIWKGSSSNIFLGSVNTLTAGGDTLTIIAPAATDLFYVNGVKQNALSPTQVIFDANNFDVAGYFGAGIVKEGSKLIEFYVDDNETLVPNTRVEYPDPRNCTGTWIIDISPDHPAGTFELRLVVNAGVSVAIQWGDSDSFAEDVPVPTVTGVTGQVVRVYHPNNKDWIDLYLGDDSGAGDPYLPGAGTHVDNVVVYAALDRADNMQFMSVPYYYNIVGPHGDIGYPFTGLSRTLTDNRIWGTTCIDNMADAALKHMTYDPTFEYNQSGLLSRRHLGNTTDWQAQNLSAPSLDVRQSGGICYIRGKRLDVEGDTTYTTLSDNQTTIIWVDYEGTLHYDDFTADPFAGTYQQAIEWLIGYPQDRDLADFPAYVYDSEVTPQRGLPLYVITTLAGAVTTTVDLTKFVGSHVENWSVGASANSAQFASLEAAFAYAAHDSQASATANRNITIKLVGDSVIDTTVIQPSNVTVEGSWDSSNIVTVSPSAPDTDGSWQLSAGCVVKDVYVSCTVAGPVFGIANNVLLDHIYFTSATGNFTTLTQTATDVTIRECYIRADLGMFYEPGALGASFDRMKIEDCYIYSTTSQGTALVRLDDAPFAEITGNNISKDNTDIEPVIEVSSSEGVRIEKNLVRIGQGDGSAVEKGIYVFDSVGVQIKGNVVTTVSGSTSVAGIGIQASDCSAVIIEENIVNFMGLGILAGAYSNLPETAYFENATISNNLVASCYSCGIMANANTNGSIANTIVGVRIEGNQVHQMAKSAVADALFGADLSSIYVIINDTTLTSVRDIIVNNNTVDGVDNLQVGGATIGIPVIIYASTASNSITDNIEINDNSISRLTCTAGNYVDGIVFQVTSGNPGIGTVRNVSCSRNNVMMVSTLSSGSIVEGIWLATFESAGSNNTTYLVKVDNNNVYIATAFPYTGVGDGIVVANDGIDSFKQFSISNNNISVPWYGIKSSIQDRSIISDNNIYAGCVGIYSPWLFASTISDNYIRVDSNNENSYLSIDSTNYGQMGILVTTAYTESVIRGNKVELYENYSSNELARGSACYALATSGTHFEFEGNTSLQHYTDLASTGGTEQAFHVYIENPDYVWSCSRNVIYNDGIYTPAPSKSHGVFVTFPGGGPDLNMFRGVVNANTIFGSSKLLGGGPYEMYLATTGVLTQGSFICMNNYVSLYLAAPSSGDIPEIFISAGYRSNSANMRDHWTGAVWDTVVF